jgi:hypothetical protein
MADNTDEFRKRAEACQRQADSADDLFLKRQYELFAEHWLELAQFWERGPRRTRSLSKSKRP